MGASLFWRCSGQTNRLTPHPSPLPLRGGEGESLAVRPRRWRRKSSNGQALAIAEPTAPPDSLSPSEGERAGVRGLPRYQRIATMSSLLLPLGGTGLACGLRRFDWPDLRRHWDAPDKVSAF